MNFFSIYDYDYEVYVSMDAVQMYNEITRTYLVMMCEPPRNVEKRRAGQAVGSSKSGDEEMVLEQRRPSRV